MKQCIIVKRRHARSVRPDPSGHIFTFSGRSQPPSLLLGSDFAFATLSAREEPNVGEEPNATPFELVALLLLALPLLFTLQKFVVDEANGERSQ